jgi:ubiquinone/menaquinone biosynthesis C-methylase UbiE
VDSKSFYERMYGDQAEAPPEPSFLYRKFRRFEINRYDLACKLAPGGNSVLDIGCGDGDLMVLLKDKYQEIWGVDIALPRIDRIQKKTGKDSGFHFKEEDANKKLSFKDGYFNTVIAISFMEHIFDPYQFIKECHRLLHQGGTFIIQVPNLAFLPNRIRLLAGQLPVTSKEMGWDGGHLHYFTIQTLKKLLVSQGFEVVKITSGGIFARVRRIWGSLLGPDIFIVGRKK